MGKERKETQKKQQEQVVRIPLHALPTNHSFV